MKEKGVLSIDDTLLTHTGRDIEHIVKLYDHVSHSYVWAHNLVTLHYSDDWTDYPVSFALWKPVDVAKLEAGMRAAGVPIKKSKEVLKESAPDKWRSYLVCVWKRRRSQYPQIQTLYATPLNIKGESYRLREKRKVGLLGRPSQNQKKKDVTPMLCMLSRFKNRALKVPVTDASIVEKWIS